MLPLRDATGSSSSSKLPPTTRVARVRSVAAAGDCAEQQQSVETQPELDAVCFARQAVRIASNSHGGCIVSGRLAERQQSEPPHLARLRLGRRPTAAVLPCVLQRGLVAASVLAGIREFPALQRLPPSPPSVTKHRPLQSRGLRFCLLGAVPAQCQSGIDDL